MRRSQELSFLVKGVSFGLNFFNTVHHVCPRFPAYNHDEKLLFMHVFLIMQKHKHADVAN